MTSTPVTACTQRLQGLDTLRTEEEALGLVKVAYPENRKQAEARADAASLEQQRTQEEVPHDLFLVVAGLAS